MKTQKKIEMLATLSQEVGICMRATSHVALGCRILDLDATSHELTEIAKKLEGIQANLRQHRIDYELEQERKVR